jgi:3',5'-cyclic AMP phosphodiesterase CpdA
MSAIAATMPNPTAKESVPLRFAIVSDTHLGRDDSQTPANYWEQAAIEIATTECEFVLHLGDIVDQGREDQYPIHQAIRAKIGKPVHEIPGNHDPVDLFRKHIRPQVDITFDQSGVRFVLFNNSKPESHDGFISDEQITWLSKTFADAARKQLRIFIAAHVPIHQNRPPDRAWYVKPKDGQTRFYELVEKYRNRITAIIHGHFHNGLRGWDDRAPINEVCCPSVLSNLDRKLAAQNAPGYNLPEFRPGYLLAELSFDSLKLDYQPIGQKIKATKLISLS